MATYRVVPINAIVQIPVEGDLDLASSRSLLLGLARDAETAGHHLLIDLRAATSELSYPEVYDLVQVLAEHPAAFTGRIALLDRYSERFEKSQFFEASAAHFGFHVRAFVDEPLAVEWLEEGAGHGVS